MTIAIIGIYNINLYMLHHITIVPACHENCVTCFGPTEAECYTCPETHGLHEDQCTCRCTISNFLCGSKLSVAL